MQFFNNISGEWDAKELFLEWQKYESSLSKLSKNMSYKDVLICNIPQKYKHGYYEVALFSNDKDDELSNLDK